MGIWLCLQRNVTSHVNVTCIKSKVGLLQTALSWANAGVLFDARVGRRVAFETIKLIHAKVLCTIFDINYHPNIAHIIMQGASIWAHIESSFKNLKLLKIQDILTLQTLKIYHKFRNNKLPYYIQNWPLLKNSNIHNQKTRGANALHKNRCLHVFCTKVP